MAIDRPTAISRQQTVSTWCGYVGLAAVLAISALAWVGWATGAHGLTRILPDWPSITPWTVVLVAILAVGILIQSGRPSLARAWIGCAAAAAAGVLAAVFLAEYATGNPFGLDDVLFREAVRTLPDTFPGRRPSLQTAWSVLLLAVAVTLTRVDRRWSRVIWSLCLAAAATVPIVTALAHLFGANSLIVRQSIPAAVSLLLLVAATFAVRPDRNPVAWLLARPDRWPLVRMVGIIAALPILVGLMRLILLALGVGPEAERVISIAVGTVIVASVAFYYGLREHRLLNERQQLRSQNAEVERRYQLIAENAVDIVAYLHGAVVVWISPSVEVALGWPNQDWIGQDFRRRIHPDDLNGVASTLQTIADGNSATVRARAQDIHGRYHWFEARGKPSIDGDGDTDGLILAARDIDAQIDAERRLQRLARVDALTGLANHGEAYARLQATLADRRAPGSQLGLLFCDVDHFKTVNDTWGHIIGDVVLATLAARINECIRKADTVGRIGGDELLVLLPHQHSLDNVVQTAEKIRRRVADPIHHDGNIIRVSLSIGAVLSEPGESADSVLARADAAMYQAKRAGRNMVIRVGATIDSGGPGVPTPGHA